MRESHITRVSHVLSLWAIGGLCLAFLALDGCGQRSGGAEAAKVVSGRSNAMSHFGSSVSIQNRPVHWGIRRTKEREVKLFAFVPYCSGTQPKPRVAKVKRRSKQDRVVLTMIVRFPVRKSGGCLGVDLEISSTWIVFGRDLRSVRLYDGKSSPPELRWPERHQKS
jgi:hypothetical protein